MSCQSHNLNPYEHLSDELGSWIADTTPKFAHLKSVLNSKVTEWANSYAPKYGLGLRLIKYLFNIGYIDKSIWKSL